MEERDQKRKERRALIEAEKQRKEEARLVGYWFRNTWLIALTVELPDTNRQA